MKRPALIFFARAPLPGKVKTRLSRRIGDDLALDLYRTMGKEILTRITRPDAWDTLVFFSPREEGQLIKEWLGTEYRYLPQRGDDLGERMHAALKDARALGHPGAVLTGSDIPELSADHIERAFTALDSADVVLGPAADGGYYLVGMKEPRREIFRGIEWSGGTVYRDTCQKIVRAGLLYTAIDTLCDIDGIEDIRSLVSRQSPSPGTHDKEELPRTLRLCKSILENT
jgi:hypothetical protein